MNGKFCLILLQQVLILILEGTGILAALMRIVLQPQCATQEKLHGNPKPGT